MSPRIPLRGKAGEDEPREDEGEEERSRILHFSVKRKEKGRKRKCPGMIGGVDFVHACTRLSAPAGFRIPFKFVSATD